MIAVSDAAIIVILAAIGIFGFWLMSRKNKDAEE